MMCEKNFASLVFLLHLADLVHLLMAPFADGPSGASQQLGLYHD